MILDMEKDPLELVAMEYLDLHSLYDILDQSGVTQEEVVAHLLRTSFIELPPYLEYLLEVDEDEETDEWQNILEQIVLV